MIRGPPLSNFVEQRTVGKHDGPPPNKMAQELPSNRATQTAVNDATE